MSETTKEIEIKLNKFLSKNINFFNASSLYILIEEYISQKYLHTNKIYGYNAYVTHNKSIIKLDIYYHYSKNADIYDTININILQLVRKQKLLKINLTDVSRNHSR